MDEILKQLQSPGWWFTVVFVAILVALLAGWLKDAGTRWLSRSSAWYRQWHAATLSKQEQELKFLAAEPAVLTLHLLHHMSALLFCFFFFGLFLFLPVWSVLIHSSPTFSSWFLYSPLPGTDPNAWISDYKVLIILLGGLALVSGFIGMSGISVGIRAYRRLYDRKKAEFERNPDAKPTD
jgi:hypothetical protein